MPALISNGLRILPPRIGEVGVESESTFHGLDRFRFEPEPVGRAAGVRATPSARRIAFQQVVPEFWRVSGSFPEAQNCWHFCWHSGVEKVTSHSPEWTCDWRRGSESNRRLAIPPAVEPTLAPWGWLPRLEMDWRTASRRWRRSVGYSYRGTLVRGVSLSEELSEGGNGGVVSGNGRIRLNRSDWPGQPVGNEALEGPSPASGASSPLVAVQQLASDEGRQAPLTVSENVSALSELPTAPRRHVHTTGRTP